MPQVYLRWDKTTKTITLLLISILFLLIPVFNSPDFNWRFSFLDLPPFKRSFLAYCLLLAFFFLHHFYLQPKLFQLKYYTKYTLAIVTAYTICSFLPIILIPNHYGTERILFAIPDSPLVPGHPGPMTPDNHFLLIATQNTFQFLFVTVISFTVNWYGYLKKSEQARSDAELSNLKAQIQPHFLFNTLNNIYALAITGSGHTAEAISQLSQMMRYLFDKSAQKWVKVQDEMDYLRNFISLQQLRFTEKVQFSYQTEGDVKSYMYIAPLVLIPFIENAFKYGINPDTDCKISICIKVKNKRLILKVNNKISSRANPYTESSGIGINNVKARLNYLYPQNHSLDIQRDEEYFDVTLDIPIRIP